MNLESFLIFIIQNNTVFQFCSKGLIKAIKKDIKDERNKEQNHFYTGSIQDESTSRSSPK